MPLQSSFIHKLLILITCCLLLFSGCERKPEAPQQAKLRVVTTIFPIYDFARVVGGEQVEVIQLLTPGVEPHNFEPTPETIITLSKADLFIFSGSEMEPWAEKLAAGVVRNGKPVMVVAGKGARYISPAENPDHDEHEGHNHGKDPHIWLDFDNAAMMVDRITDSFGAVAPVLADRFKSNAAAYRAKLKSLGSRFTAGPADCQSRQFVHGGHYAFAYLAERYKLSYSSAFGMTADSEPSSAKLAGLVKTIREKRLKYVFYEELLSPRTAETVAAETGAELLKLHGVHNITRKELESGATYLSLMEQNLDTLRKGLVCR